MNRVPVISSNIDSVGYDEGQELLEVAFRRGGVWHYRNVPRDVYRGMLQADSPGKFFLAYVKGKFSEEKIAS